MDSRTKKIILIISSLALCVIFMVGCNNPEGYSPANSETNLLENHYVNDAEYHDLSEDGSFVVTATIGTDEIHIIDQKFMTNSHVISVENKSSVDITVYLFLEGELGNAIREVVVGSGETKSFTGLTSRFFYNLGFTSNSLLNLDVTISD